jgi:L-amino acid N-acyltransferase YncA
MALHVARVLQGAKSLRGVPLPSEADRMSSKPGVRGCTHQDLAQVREIYALEVREGTASFELAPPSLAEMTARFAAIEAAGLPYLVAELEGRIAGYAYAAPYRPRPAYRYTVEDSVYVARWARRRGVGHALLAAVIERASVLGMRQMVAIIGDSAHTASIELHARAGFRLVGTLEHVGWKFGRWLDTVIMQRPLGPGAAVPAMPEPRVEEGA